MWQHAAEPERHVADLDVEHELQILLPQRGGGLDHLQPGLGGERHLRSVDFTIFVQPSMSTIVPVDDTHGVSE